MVKFLRAKKDKKNHRRASQTGVYGKMEPVQQTTEISDSRNKAQKVKGEVDEVVDIMNQNIKKVVERGENLEDLEAKTGIKVCAYFRCFAAELKELQD